MPGGQLERHQLGVEHHRDVELAPAQRLEGPRVLDDAHGDVGLGMRRAQLGQRRRHDARGGAREGARRAGAGARRRSTARTSASARRSWARTVSAWRSRTSPAGVSVTPRASRTSRRVPSWRSRRAICWEMAGWVKESAVAASENEPRVATSRKTDSRRASNITPAYQSEKATSLEFIWPGSDHPSHDLHRLPHHPSRHRRRRGGPDPPRRPRLEPRPQRRAARRRARRQPRRRAVDRHRRRHRRPVRAHRRHRRLDARPGARDRARRARRSCPATSAARCSGGRRSSSASACGAARRMSAEPSRRRVSGAGRAPPADRARSLGHRSAHGRGRRSRGRRTGVDYAWRLDDAQWSAAERPRAQTDDYPCRTRSR